MNIKLFWEVLEDFTNQLYGLGFEEDNEEDNEEECNEKDEEIGFGENDLCHFDLYHIPYQIDLFYSISN